MDFILEAGAFVSDLDTIPEVAALFLRCVVFAPFAVSFLWLVGILLEVWSMGNCVGITLESALGTCSAVIVGELVTVISGVDIAAEARMLL